MTNNRETEDIILVSIFLILITLPLISFVLPIDATPFMLENRRLVTDPGFENIDDAVANFPEKFEPYFNDQFGFRRLFVRISNFLNSRFEGNIVANLALTGKQGWLYSQMQYYYRHEYPMQKGDLEKARNSLRTRQKWLEEQGIKHLLVICPLKATIYPEYLPDNMLRPNGISMIDEMLEYLKKDKDINILDLRPVLKKAREEQQVYTPSDFHWNDHGALAAANALAARLKQWYPDLKDIDTASFTISEEEKQGGELAVGLGLSNVYSKTEVTYNPHASDNSYYKYFYNRGGLQISHNGDKDYPDIMFVHDSFGEKPRKFMSMLAGTSVFYWDVAPRKNLVNSWKPDVVVELYMETNTLKNVVNPFWPDTDIISLHEGTEFTISLPASTREVNLDIRTLEYDPEVQQLKLSWGGEELAPLQITRKGGKSKILLPESSTGEKSLILVAEYQTLPLGKARKTKLQLPFDLYLASASNQRPSGLFYLKGEMQETAKGYNLIPLSESGEKLETKSFDINNYPETRGQFVEELSAALKLKSGYLIIFSHGNIKKGFSPEIAGLLSRLGSKAELSRSPHMGHYLLFDLQKRELISEYSGLKTGIAFSGDNPIEGGFIISGMRIK